MTEWIGAAEAAARLGIKPASLYAYVSRGVLTRRQDPGGRASLYDAREIARLARKGRPRRVPAGSELVIETAVTQIAAGHLRYRGQDVTELAARCDFEEVALLLWGGVPATGERGGWQATAVALAAGRTAQSALPEHILPLERLQVIVPALAALDPLRLQLDPPAVIAAARAMIAGMVGSLPPPSPPGRHGHAGTAAAAAPTAGLCGSPEAGSIAERLAAVLHAGPPPGARLSSKTGPRPGSAPSMALAGVVRTALVLLADHELAASTLAARVAASVRADPYAVVSAGLGAFSGTLHGGASLAVEAMLGSAGSADDAPRVVGDLLRRGQRIPGLGHFAYPAGDPRCVVLMRVIGEYAPASPRLAAARAVIGETRRRALPEPSVDFALGTLTSVAGLVPGSGEAIFAVARAAGWIAHALEEYARNAPIRLRAVYTGPAPAGSTAGNQRGSAGIGS
ncbi:MAG: citrate/2-methylcitrate synthase [Streptosporangiaceae bacterium]